MIGYDYLCFLKNQIQTKYIFENHMNSEIDFVEVLKCEPKISESNITSHCIK